MKLFYSGFNLYNHFKYHDFMLKNFTEVLYKDCADIIICHTFSLIINNENQVMYHGSALNQFTLPPEFKIKQISSTDKIVILLTEKGALFRLDTTDFIAKPLLQHIEKQFHRIACGSKITIALTQDGELYNLPNKLNFLSKDIIDIQAGCEHCLLLSKNGDVYSFGCGSRGQLGHGSLENEAEPQLIRALAGIKINKIAAGGWHSCAVSADGDLYIWGWNGNGQLGLFSNEQESVGVLALPQVVDICDESECVVEVGCGNRHTVVLLDNGMLYGAGWNKYYQLGSLIDLKKESVYKMSFLGNFSDMLQDVKKVDIKCGPWSTGIITH